MKIFQTSEISASESVKSSSTKGSPRARKKAASPEKKPVSEQEIREKLASHVETSNTAKAVIQQKNTKKFGEGFMNENIPVTKPAEAESEESPSVKESHLLMSDVQLNDPKDPNTQEKLKSVLSKGAFNFNPREKETLEKILAD